MRKRVLLAGLYHETHTFMQGRTTLKDFTIRRGAEILSCRDDSSPIGGVIQFAQKANWQLLPIVDLYATPSAIVDDRVVEFFWDNFRALAEKEIRKAIDGIYLVLHGAMVSESILDVEGEILTRIRGLKNAGDVPVCGVMDLHANFTQLMAEHTHGLIAFRKNPHTDAKDAAVDAAALLQRLMSTDEKPVTVWAHSPIMWPPTGNCTDAEPMCSLEEIARRIESQNEDILTVNVLAGFAFADTPDTGVSFTAITTGRAETARAKLQELCDYAVHNRALGNVIPPDIEKILPKLGPNHPGPVVIVEPSDNIGGGAPGDCTGAFRALIKHKVNNALCIINDPEAVKKISTIKIGEDAKISIGGKGSRLDPGPVELDVELISTSNGRFELEDSKSHLASMGTAHIDMGPCAVVCHNDITILLTSIRTPPFDLGQLRSQGLEPKDFSVIVVKAAVAHKRAYDPIAKASYTVDTPGPCSSNLKSFPFRKVKRPIYPLDELDTHTSTHVCI